MSDSYLPPVNSIQLVRGTSLTVELAVEGSDGVAADITGARVVLTVKRFLADQIPLVQKDTLQAAQAVVTDPRDGLVEFYFRPEDTHGLDPKTYVFDVWVLLPTGDRHAVVDRADFEVLPSVTVIPL